MVAGWKGLNMSRPWRRIVAITAVLAAALTGVSASPAGGVAGFGDVRTDDFYAAGVQWLVDEGLTTGTSTGCFSPDDTLSRAQFATFVWRYEGEPYGGQHPFVDVAPGQFHSEAVAWMYRAGITTGISPTEYGPDNTITRGELATFLWRLAGTPSAPRSNFSDVPRDAFFARATDWMVSEGITTGTSSNTFSPYRELTRGEFATFLLRYDGSPPVTVMPGGVCLADGSFDPFGVVAYMNDFSEVDSMSSLETGVQHRDNHVRDDTLFWPGDHASTGGVNCTGPDETRTVTRAALADDAVYMCHPGGDPSKGHVMTSIGSTSGYSWAWMMPTPTFNDVVEVRWDVNITDLGLRQFTEVMVIPAENWSVDSTPTSVYDDEGGDASLPCLRRIFAFPCVDRAPGYSDWDAVGTSTFNQKLIIATQDGNEVEAAAAPDTDPAKLDLRERRTHFFRDNGDGTIIFGQEQADGSYRTVTAQGSFPQGEVRVVFKDHDYTPHKDLGPFGERYTWHWDNLTVFVDGNSQHVAYDGMSTSEYLSVVNHDSAFCELPVSA